MKYKKTIISLCLLGSFCFSQFVFNASPSSGLMYGQATFNGASPEPGDWIGAYRSTFPSDTICVGGNRLEFNNGLAYIVMQIYGDDPETIESDGMVSGQSFFLVLWDSSLAQSDPNSAIYCQQGLTEYGGWENTNGAPLPDYSDYTTVYDFSESVYLDVVKQDQNNFFPNKMRLHGNFPNPFNPLTKIAFSISEQMDIELTIYNINGKIVYSKKHGNLNSGYNIFSWNGKANDESNVSSGVYIYKILSDKQELYGRMVFMK